ncbi:MAG: ogr/Delta-like zinc finger family protein [Burkholderia gladioli]
MRFSMDCPHCGAHMTARALEKLSGVAWLIDYQCDDFHCGYAWRTRLDLCKPPPLDAVVDAANDTCFESSAATGSVSKPK